MARCCFAALLVCCAALAHGGARAPASSDAARARRLRRESFGRRVQRRLRLVYSVTAINPALAIIANNYVSKRVITPLTLPPAATSTAARGATGAAVALYGTLFSWVRLQPRLLFAIGAALRALQQTTVLQLVFDPSAGVGAGLNLLCLLTAARWPATLILGWAASKPAWRFLGARPPASVHVPISVTVGSTAGARPWFRSRAAAVGTRS